VTGRSAASRLFPSGWVPARYRGRAGAGGFRALSRDSAALGGVPPQRRERLPVGGAVPTVRHRPWRGGSGQAASPSCGCQKVGRRLWAACSPREALAQMIGGWRFDCSIWASASCWDGWCCWRGARRPRTRNCWCCVTRSRCCGVRWPDPGWTGPTVRCWLDWPGCCPARAGTGCSSGPRRYCAGIKIWSDAAGATPTRVVAQLW